MDPQKELALIERARTAPYTETDSVTWYDNVLERGGSQALLVAIRLRMRLDFPRAAKRKFGARTDDVVETLTRLQTVPMGDFDSAAALYRSNLVELGAAPKS